MGRIGVALACVLLSGTAAADDVSFGIKLGTLGIGAEFTRQYSPTFAGRLGVNGFDDSEQVNKSNVDYDFKLKLRSVAALADWHPLRGSFRTTAGIMYNGNRVDLSANPSSNLSIGSNTYTPAQLGSLQGRIDVRKLSPYVGVGWSNGASREKTWGVAADLGALYQGKPKASLSASCGSLLSASLCGQLQQDVADERQQLEEELDSFRWYPVLSVRASYHF